MRARCAVVQHRVIAASQLLDDRTRAALALDRQLHLDRDPSAIEQDDRVSQMLLRGSLLARQHPLAHPFALGRARLDMQAHLGHRRDMREQPKRRAPHTEGQARRAQPLHRRYHPRRLADEHPAHLHQPLLAQTRKQTLHRPWSAIQERAKLVDADRVLLPHPAQRVQVAPAQQRSQRQCRPSSRLSKRVSRPRCRRQPILNNPTRNENRDTGGSARIDASTSTPRHACRLTQRPSHLALRRTGASRMTSLRRR